IREELQQQADQTLPRNARAFFPGYSVKADLMEFYRQSPIDVFMNVSASEGTPVSIMEAASCGIPVIATAVGGNTEIVSERNGILLNPNPLPEEIAQAILRLLDDTQAASNKRDGSRAVWLERYSADVNFKYFAERLKALGENA
ncbi:MAG: glycosyltransferase, partial [Chloroflexota bacterium]